MANSDHARGPIFTNRPGEKGYTPLRRVVDVHWKTPTAAVVLESDEQIRRLARQGTLTLIATRTVIDVPIVIVGSAETGSESGSA